MEQDLLKLILVVVINLVTDIGPCISVLEVKFIDLFKRMRTEKLHLESVAESEDNNHISENMIAAAESDMIEGVVQRNMEDISVAMRKASGHIN